MADGDSIGSFDELVGQPHLFERRKPLYSFYHANSVPPSMILFGPPGTGKSSYAKLLAKKHNLDFYYLNATDCSSETLKKALKKGSKEKPILLVIDEIHRFDKRQQDILLPYLEEKSVVLIGTSTYNPYFKLTKALRSRCLVYQFKRLSESDLKTIAKKVAPELGSNVVDKLVLLAGGDARRLLNMIKIASENGLSGEELGEFFGVDLGYENESERYDIISAFIKSIRASEVDAALYYLARLLEAGEDAEFIARRLCILASEDVGLADNRAITIASNCLNIVKEIGMPEAKITLSHCTIYLAKAKKSNSSYTAIRRAIDFIKSGNILEIPVYLTVKGRSLYKNPHYSNGKPQGSYLSKPQKFYIPKENDIV